jgi:subtilisin family serine protease
MKNKLFIISSIYILFFSGTFFPQVFPNDPLFNEQWYLYMNAAPSIRADIRAPEAWAITKGNSSTKIAIIENDYIPSVYHEDLLGRLTTHNTILIDDHATMVTGLIAANTNNGIGIAGLNWYAPLNAYSFSSSNIPGE